MTGAKIVKFWEALKAIRQPLEQHIRECYQVTFPIRGIQFNSSLDQSPESIQQEAATLQAQLTDSTAADSSQVLASTLVSGMTPANSLWFGVQTADGDSGEVAEYLGKKSSEVHKDIHNSNFDASGFEAMLDVVIGGLCALYIEPGEDSEYIFEAWPLATCWFAASKRGGLVDTSVRYFTMTADQAVRDYGFDKLHSKIQDAYRRNPYQRFPFLHFIAPKPIEPGKPLRKKDELLPFFSRHVDLGSKRIVRDSGYSEFPVAVPRWLRLPNSVYAQGPVSTILPDAKTLNEGERMILNALDMHIGGMWGAVDDGVLNIKTVRIGSKKVVMMKSKDSLFRIEPRGNPQLGDLKFEQKRNSIRRIMMSDQIEPINSQGPARTATEWHYRINMLRQLLGPMFGRLQSEYLQTIVFRCLGIKIRKEIMAGKKPPEALREGKLRLQYVSPLARAQQLEDVAAMDRFEQGLLEKSKFNPGSIDLYDWDAAERKRAEYLGVPKQLVLTAEKTKAAREDRVTAENQAAQNQSATAPAQPSRPTAVPAAPAEAANG